MNFKLLAIAIIAAAIFGCVAVSAIYAPDIIRAGYCVPESGK